MAKGNVKHDYIKITGVSKKSKTEITNVSDHTGISISSLLKPKIQEVIQSYPEFMRQPKTKD